VLGQMVPILIGFLASAIGIGGIAEKIKEILQKLQKPVNMAIDFLIKKGLQFAAPIIAKIKGIAGKIKGKYEAGKAWVKGKYEAGKAWVKGKVAAGKEWLKGKAAAVKEFFSVHEMFSVEGESHTLYNSGTSTDLTVASENPTALSNHPDESVRTAYAGYKAAVDAAKSPNAKKEAAKPHLRTIISVLRKWMKSAKSKDPQASAPGIGTKAPYGQLGSSLRQVHFPGAPKLWAMEKEHLLPFGVGKRLWKLVNLVMPGRGGHEDDAQMTILIYKGAANEKTPEDLELMAAFESKLVEMDVQRRLTTLRTAQAGGMETAEGTDLVAQVFQAVRVASDNAVSRTITAVQNENHSKTEGSELENGQRRGRPGTPEAPIPGAADITAAAEAQYDNVMGILETVVQDVNEGRAPNITPKRSRKNQ
jgi:hypothetical protein